MFLREIELLKDRIEDAHSYPFTIPTIQTLTSIVLAEPVSFFIGENGTGKSTLLEAIAYQCEFNTAGGGVNNTYEVNSTESSLGNYLRLSWLPKIKQGFFLRAESYFQFASHLDQLAEEDPTFQYHGYGGKSLHEQSHGESFLSLFLNRFGSRGIYLLDEPEAALSPARQLAFLRLIHQLVQTRKAQFIIATHSPILLGYPNAHIFSFDEQAIEKIEYEDTDHYRITKGFLNGRERYLQELFRADYDE
ncbi:AAA family ATPase [Ammoniphilus oxalaticus]|uniref:AAA family ATPase n=1 Tax=Ammoniphilus oxalaticus TaxID=66863 RepID=A0A419SM38_9BACL|nr:AAA family ATPase [Ammoniphilus oxalaticus]RKD25034.1 AAA family ATPase [Ammoniphilus oxalaticus]